MGVAGDLSVPDHEHLLTLADAKLSEAKWLGRHRVCFEAGRFSDVILQIDCLVK